MRVACPTCGRPIPGEDIDLPRDRALCRPCGELVGLSALAVAAQPSVAALQPAEIGWEATTTADGGWRGTIRLPREGALQIVAFGVFFTVLSLPFALVIIGLLHFYVGVSTLYRGLSMRFNRGEATIEAGRFRFRQAPLPRRGAIDAPLEDVVGFAVVAAAPARGFRAQRTPAWELRMATRDGRSVQVPLEMLDRAHAEFLAQRLNEALATHRRAGGYRFAPADPEGAAVAAIEPDDDADRPRLRARD